jgi:hypothetical protein
VGHPPSHPKNSLKKLFTGILRQNAGGFGGNPRGDSFGKAVKMVMGEIGKNPAKSEDQFRSPSAQRSWDFN